MKPYCSLLLTLCACLFIGCGSINDNQPARLISTVPAEGEVIEHDGLIHLHFDKVVTDVRVNGFAARKRDRKSSATAWEREIGILELWPPRFGFHPEKLVELNITFEDDAGRHHEKLNVFRPALHVDGEPFRITGGNVWNGAQDVDAELVSTTGIQITFSENIKAGTVVLRPKDEAWLNWIADWERDSVTLYPPDGESLQSGTAYILLIISVKNEFGGEGHFEIRFTTKD